MKRILSLLLTIALALGAASPVFSRGYHQGGDMHVRGHLVRPHGSRFSNREWRGGYWHHGYYNGVYGWFWVVGGMWLLYNQPVYPYPNQEDQQWYYFCAPLNGYYPDVTACPVPWTVVPAN